jgi:predicted DNA-binding transcriptional regulator AlpA
MNQEKSNFYINKIEKQYPDKTVLNAGQMCQIIGISRATFKRILDANNLHLLPTFRKLTHKRKGTVYHTYKADIFSIVEFLVNNNHIGEK